MGESRKYFAPCGINNLITDSFYVSGTNNSTWKPVGNLPTEIFNKHAAHMNPDFRKIGPTNSQGYFESAVGNFKFIWMNDLASSGGPNYGMIDKNTKWDCGPAANQAAFDNTVPNCGWWTNAFGANRRKDDTKHFKYQLRTGSGDLNMLFNMGHGSGGEDPASGNNTLLGTQPKSRESNVIGIDTWIRANPQNGGLVGANTNETRLGVTNIFGMYCAAMDTDRLNAIVNFLECLIDPDCEIDLDNFPFEGRTKFLNSLVSFMSVRGGFEFSEQHQQNYIDGNYNNDMISEMSFSLAILIAILGDIKDIYNFIKLLLSIIDPNVGGGGNSWIGDVDLLISYDIPTPVNELVFYKKGQNETQNRRAEYWGNNNDPLWGFKRVSYTCDPIIHAALDLIGATWNGYLFNFSHTSGNTRVRLMEMCNCFPIRTVAAGLEPDDPLQDKYMAAMHYWDKDFDQFQDRRWNRTEIRIMDDTGGIA